MARRPNTSQQHTWRQTLSNASHMALPLVIILSLLGFLVYAVYGIVRPIVKSQLLAADVGKVEAQVERKRREKQSLTDRLTWARSANGAEEIARRKGRVKKDEHAVVFQLPAPTATSSAPATHLRAAQTDLLANPLVRALACFTLAFVLGLAWLLKRRQAALAQRAVGMLTPRSELARRRRAAKPR